MTGYLVDECLDGNDTLFLAEASRIIQVAVYFKIRDPGGFKQPVL
jgi:hypothetical protein